MTIWRFAGLHAPEMGLPEELEAALAERHMVGYLSPLRAGQLLGPVLHLLVALKCGPLGQ